MMITQKTLYRKIKPYSDHGLYILLLLLSLVLLSIVTSCQKNEISSPDTCGTTATIRDLRGLDGCSFVLELENGEKLEPVNGYGFCGTPPLPVPEVNRVNFADGKRVSVAYKVLDDRVSSCMVGKIVEITCIHELGTDED